VEADPGSDRTPRLSEPAESAGVPRACASSHVTNASATAGGPSGRATSSRGRHGALHECARPGVHRSRNRLKDRLIAHAGSSARPTILAQPRSTTVASELSPCWCERRCCRSRSNEQARGTKSSATRSGSTASSSRLVVHTKRRSMGWWLHVAAPSSRFLSHTGAWRRRSAALARISAISCILTWSRPRLAPARQA